MAFSLEGRVALVPAVRRVGKGTTGVLGRAAAIVAVNYFNSEVYHASTGPFSAYVAAKSGQMDTRRQQERPLSSRSHASSRKR